MYITEAATWLLLVLQTGSMTSGDLGPLNETAQAVRVMKEKYIQWQQRLDALIAQVHTLQTAAAFTQHQWLLSCLFLLTLLPMVMLMPPAALVVKQMGLLHTCQILANWHCHEVWEYQQLVVC